MMREPFIKDKHTFDLDTIKRLYDGFGDIADFDYHLMTDTPQAEIEKLDGIIDNLKKSTTSIKVHMESCRGGNGNYFGKDVDLLTHRVQDEQQNMRMQEVYERSIGEVISTLKSLKKAGYRSGIAFEPGTSLDNLRSNKINAGDMSELCDMILLMTVHSGLGGQKFINEMLPKIKEARATYPLHEIQVDGGINDETLPLAIEAGANNIVVGSYITDDINPGARVQSLREIISK